MKPLTKAEEQIMHSIWKLEEAFLKDIIEAQPEPRPHSNTIATIVKILVELHHGKVWATSEGKNKGTSFFVSLPVDQPQFVNDEI